MNESPIFTKTYDLLLWILPQVHKFPRQYRFNLGEHIQLIAMSFQDDLILAGKSSGIDSHECLLKADVELEQLRLWMRFSLDSKLISVRQYEHVSRMISEVGRLLGGWLKKSMQV